MRLPANTRAEASEALRRARRRGCAALPSRDKPWALRYTAKERRSCLQVAWQPWLSAGASSGRSAAGTAVPVAALRSLVNKAWLAGRGALGFAAGGSRCPRARERGAAAAA